jgi:peptidoglycan/xylan/chitin deacetylase (PgdA/CDA1 family)
MVAKRTMLRKRSAVATALTRAGVLGTVAMFNRRVDRNLSVFAYHRVLDGVESDHFDSDPELVSASVSSFRQQMEFIARNFTPISCSDLERYIYSGNSLPTASAIITFDDGFEDNYLNAFPILRALSLPATFFVTTQCVDRGEPFWFETIARAVITTSKPLNVLGLPALPRDADVQSRREYLAATLRLLITLEDGARRKQVDAIIGGSAIDRDATAHRPMTWQQIREMSAAGMEFGSHTVTHPVLTKLCDAELERELVESKARIEAELRVPVTSLAYPVGGAEAHDARVRLFALRAGYRTGMCYEPGVNDSTELGSFSLRRIPVERYIDADLFRAMSLLPSVFVR